MSVRFLVSVSFRCTVLAASLLAAAGALHAQNTSVSTDPVGAVVLNFLGSSDTLVSLPLQQPVSLESTVASVTGNVVNLNLSGANLTANQYVYQGSGTSTYYAQFITGNREGMYYTITANDNASNVTLDLAGDTGFSGNVNVGDSVQIIPYWTLNTLFPNGNGTLPSSSFGAATRQSEVLFPDIVDAGTNLAFTGIYYYYNGTANGGAGWRQSGVPGTIVNDLVVTPDTAFIVRLNEATNTTTTLVGSVSMGGFSTPLSTLAANTQQDIVVGVAVPANITLLQSNLSAVFTPSTSFGAAQRKDQLLVYSNSTPGQNKAFPT
ncbi:MAG: TIGR02597 family protein, partial [Opitutales bacterium]